MRVEFGQFSFDVKLQIATKFPTAPVVEHSKGAKFGNEELRAAVKVWGENKEDATALYGHISGWDVGETTDMSFLFEHMEDFNEDISRWDVSNIQKLRGMFYNAKVFNQDISSWNTANTTDMQGMFLGAGAFNKDYIKDWVNKPKK